MTRFTHIPKGKAAIDVLTNIGKNRNIAIIGQMRELGDLREQEYRKVGDYVYEQGIDVLITYGYRTEEIGAQANPRGFPTQNTYHFTDKDKMHELLKEIVKKNDTILVKGASKTNMFDTVQFLDQTFR